MSHLGELRTRLVRAVVVIAVLGVGALFFSKTIFWVLMRPVLDALPPESRSLIYTSGIEEINVLMKVGMYAGVFLATPVILWQIWGFVSPGLLPAERKFAGPFVFLGSLAFLTGALFCYFVLLPTMFQFLLGNADAAPTEQRVRAAETREAEAVRYVRLGELGRAAEIAHETSESLAAMGDGRVLPNPTSVATGAAEVSLRLAGLGRLVDAVNEGMGESARPVLRRVMDTRLEALQAVEQNHVALAGTRADEAAALFETATDAHAQELGALWRFERHLAMARSEALTLNWTRPMLTMSEQLTLVLMLELALGIIFEMPLVMALLTSLGILKTRFLMKYQRHAFVVCLILAAVITPTGDAINLALMAGPMILCYELGVAASWLIERQRARNNRNIVPLGPPAV